MPTITLSHRRFPVAASRSLHSTLWTLAATAACLFGQSACAGDEVRLVPSPATAAQNAVPATAPGDNALLARNNIAAAFRDSANTQRSSPLWTFGTLTALLAAAWVGRGTVRKRHRPAGSNRYDSLVEVMDIARIDKQLTVHVLRIGSRVLAVGLSPSGLTTLTVFDD
ncbi:MAG: hypothetical protein AB7I48_19430, partial [Planctomycetaceae bacterium]